MRSAEREEKNVAKCEATPVLMKLILKLGLSPPIIDVNDRRRDNRCHQFPLAYTLVHSFVHSFIYLLSTPKESICQINFDQTLDHLVEFGSKANQKQKRPDSVRVTKVVADTTISTGRKRIEHPHSPAKLFLPLPHLRFSSSPRQRKLSFCKTFSGNTFHFGRHRDASIESNGKRKKLPPLPDVNSWLEFHSINASFLFLSIRFDWKACLHSAVTPFFLLPKSTRGFIIVNFFALFPLLLSHTSRPLLSFSSFRSQLSPTHACAVEGLCALLSSSSSFDVFFPISSCLPTNDSKRRTLDRAVVARLKSTTEHSQSFLLVCLSVWFSSNEIKIQLIFS